MASSRLGDVVSMTEELIKKACLMAMKAHKSPEKPYLMEKNRSSSDVIFSFPGFWSLDYWFTGQPFGEKKIDLAQFPSLRTIGMEEVAAVNEAFLNRFQEILPQLQNEVERAVKEKRQIIFTGHSSAGPIAILMTVWFLEKYRMLHCVTFGSPLVGDSIFNHALRRQDWSQHFIHFVMRYDIFPRLLLAPLSSIKRELPNILLFLSPKRPLLMQKPNEEALALYVNVMRNASSVASHVACQLTGNTNKLLETLSSFVELSPYRPFGTYVFCTGNGDLVVIRNPDAVLQSLFYSSQLRSETEVPVIAVRSLEEHLNYQSELQSLERKSVARLDNLEGLPLSSDGAAAGNLTIGVVLNNLGLSTRARLCLRAAGELEKQKLRNQDKISKKMTDIEKGLQIFEGYKTKCEARRVSYYDAFKLSKDADDFNANVKRLELAGIFDETIEMLKKYELPEEFEGQLDWINIGTRYRRLVEPLDIANYYRHLKNEDTGPYMTKGRPKRYKFMQKWLEYYRKMPAGSSGESCFWAEVEELCLNCDWERVSILEKQVVTWVSNETIGHDVFFNESTFMTWWNTLPQQHRSASCISNLLNKAGKK